MESLMSLSLLPTLPLFFLIFISIYLLAYLSIFRNWRGLSRAEASSCFTSLFHGTPALVLAIFSILHHPTTTAPLAYFASPNTSFQNTVLEYSTAYFFTDLFHYLIFVPNDYLFIAHHLATIYVFLTCRYVVNHGAFSLLVLLILAEVTSACQNTLSLSKFRQADSPLAAKVCEYLSPSFCLFYFVVRGILGPIVVYKMVVFYYSSGGGNGLIPMWAWVSWMVVIVSAILVSILWVYSVWMDVCRERRSKKQGKKLS